MGSDPNKFSQFWQELKRRKVTRVIIVYAASAFAILEAADIIFPRLNLPDWWVDIILYILGLGFIVMVILSWVYDLTPEGLKVTESLEIERQKQKNGKSVQSQETKIWKVISYISILLIIALLIMNIVRSNNQSKELEKFEKSIAVLPFENLGPSEHAYFTDGMTEEITCLLASIKALGVVSRKSARHYAKTDKTIKQIGKELGVNYILEGTVRWATNLDGIDRVRITPELIRVSDDTHIWADKYDRELNDVFKIQTEIAQQVVEQLNINLLEGEQNALKIQPTDNLEAYQAYLRGRYFIGREHFSLETWNHAVQNFQQAVEIDTSFTLAYAELARAHARFYNLRYDLSESRLEKADQAAAKALELGSYLSEVHLALGYYYLWAYRSHKQALKHLEIAERGLPNNVEILQAKAAIFEPMGRWDDYLSSLQKAIKLSPREASNFTDIALGFWLTRQYKEAIDACNQSISLAPDGTWSYLFKTYASWSWQGVSNHSRETIKSVPSNHEFYLWSCYYQETGEGNFQAAQQILSDTTNNWISHKLYTRPKSLLSAFIYTYVGDHMLAKKNYRTAIKLLENKVREYPKDPRYHSSLGVAYAGLGEKARAIEEGEKAIQLLPISADAVYGISYVIDLAIIYTLLGDFDLALDKIEYLLSIPSWISIPWLEMDIHFAPLKTLPRYKELATKYAVE